MSTPTQLNEYRIQMPDGEVAPQNITAATFNLEPVGPSEQWFIFRDADGKEVYRISARYVVSIRLLKE